MLIYVFSLDYAYPHSSSIYSTRDYTRYSSIYLINPSFIISTIFSSQRGNSEILFSEICIFLRFEKKISKAMDDYVVDFTGIELDIDKMEARLPQDKHNHASTVVQHLLQRGSMSSKDLQNILDFLSFCIRVISLVRSFLRNLFNFLQSMSHIHPYSIRRLSSKSHHRPMLMGNISPQLIRETFNPSKLVTSFMYTSMSATQKTSKNDGNVMHTHQEYHVVIV